MGKDTEIKKRETKGTKFPPYLIRYMLMCEVSNTLCVKIAGLRLATNESNSKEIEKLMLKKTGNKPVFSDYCSLLDSEDGSSLMMFQDEPSIMNFVFPRPSYSIDMRLNYKKHFDFFSGGFEFSEHPEEFQFEFETLLQIYSHLVSDGSFETVFDGVPESYIPKLPQKDDPIVDYVLMRALYHAGKMVERLKKDGLKRSDIPTKAGRTKWKTKINKQDVIEEFYRMDTNGKSKNKICEEIRVAFIKRGKKENEVYSTKQIGRFLKNELPKIR